MKLMRRCIMGLAALCSLSAYDLANARGLDWPDHRIFPRFSDIQRLDVMDARSIAPDFMTPLVTLQGLVNRVEPRIYLLENTMPSQLWLKELEVPSETVQNPLDLFLKYRSEITGLVIYDESKPDTINLATTMASLRNGIVANGAAADRLRKAPYDIPVIEDLRGRFENKIQIYSYLLERYAQDANHRILVGLDPFFRGQLRDYAMATKSLMVWLDPRNKEERLLLDSFFRLYKPNSPYMGWWANEAAGVEAASRFGIPTYASDWSTNLSVLGGKQFELKAPRIPTVPKLENKIYVATFMSDGDNVQENQGLIPLKWADPARGQTPISWTVSPALVDLAPVILKYFQKTATPNDNLVSGPSGLGYTYPTAWPGGKFIDYARVSGRYMDAAGLRIATLWNNGARLSPEHAKAYTSSIPNLIGLTIQDQDNSREFLDHGIPLTSFAISYGDHAEILRIGIEQALKSFNGTAPVFAAIQGNMNMGPNRPTAFHELAQSYAKNPNVVFVRGDHFFELMKAARYPVSHRLFSGDFDGDGRTDAGFYYQGNGDFWIGNSRDGRMDWSNGGNVFGFGDLMDNNHKFFDGDFNGDGKADMLFVNRGDQNWWLGKSNGSAFNWQVIANTKGFGDVISPSHKILTGDFNGDRKTDVLIYYNGDSNWWLGLSDGNQLNWNLATNTAGFQNLLDGDHGIYTGDFNGDGRSDIAVLYRGDGNLWFGLSNGSTFDWRLGSNTKGFGDILSSSHQIMVADVNGDRRSDFVFYHKGDGNFWAGLSADNGLNWNLMASLPQLGNLLDTDHRIYLKDMNGDGKDDLLTYCAESGSLNVGISNGTQFEMQAPSDVRSFGNLIDRTRELFVGTFQEAGKNSVLFHYNGDSNWWLGSFNGSQFEWQLVSNTAGFGNLLQ